MRLDRTVCTRLNRLEHALLSKPWREARPGVKVKLLPEGGELYVFAENAERIAKERSMRRRQLKWLWARLAQLQGMTLTRDELLMKLGSARSKVPGARRLVEVDVDEHGAVFTYRLNRKINSSRSAGARVDICCARTSPRPTR
jgi:hypothetical protein